MKIVICHSNTDEKRWNEFVDKNNGSFYHYYQWKYVYEKNGYKSILVKVLNENNEIIGIFPFYKVEMFLNDSMHSAIGGGAYGAPLSNDIKVIELLLNYFDEVCKKEKIVYSNINLNNFFKYNNFLIELLSKKGFKNKYFNAPNPVTFIIKTNSYKEIWEKEFNQKIRNKIRKAKKSGVKIIINNWQLLDKYYEMLADTHKRLASSIPLKSEFRYFFSVFKDKTNLFMAMINDKAIAGAYCCYSNKVCYALGNVSYPQYWEYAPNNLLYGTIIEDACKQGYDYFDFGSTAPNSTHHEWKSQYGGTKLPILQYEKTYQPLKKLLRDKTIKPRVFIRKLIWQHIISLEANDKINPKILKMLKWF